VERVDRQLRVRQHLTDRGRVRRGRDLVTPPGWRLVRCHCLVEPVDNPGSRMAADLPQQSLRSGEVDEPGLPRVDPLPRSAPSARRAHSQRGAPNRVSSMPTTGSARTAAPAARWSITARTGRARRRPRRRCGRPRPLRRTPAQPIGHPAPRRDLGDRLGERPARTPLLPAPPPPPTPADRDRVLAVGRILQRRRDLLLR
jgi:hypothetical protein